MAAEARSTHIWLAPLSSKSKQANLILTIFKIFYGIISRLPKSKWLYSEFVTFKGSNMTVLMHVFSNSTGTGMYANSDSTIVFLPLQKFVTPERFATLLDIFDESANTFGPDTIEGTLYPVQRSFLAEGKVPISEFGQFSSGFFTFMPNESYITMGGSLLVGVYFHGINILEADAVLEASTEQRKCGKSVDLTIELVGTRSDTDIFSTSQVSMHWLLL